ncbi:MAG: hypothetical protein M1832_002834 [Thelocarpon impressellum]|nr:MAG: hypothetical protein M1832_002834 [Thelocarpon impressellum]
MRQAAAQNAGALRALLEIIHSHGLEKVFSVHLVHKHFDIPEGRVMVYETVHGPNHPDFVLSSPRLPERCENLRGLYFQATPDNKMVAYEFTTDPGDDLAPYAAFVLEFNATVIDHGVRNVFALTAKATETKVLTEFEMPDLASTILACQPSWLPTEGQDNTSTDWISKEATVAGGVPGVIQLKCIETRSTGHYNVTCSRTRSGQHYQSRPVGPSGEGQTEESELYLDGKLLSADSEAFAIISHARDIVGRA